MTTDWGTVFDVAVVGGGPAGASAAWRAASLGASVVLLDRATFPRDKPCGDGLTPRGVKLLGDMGLADELEKFHPVRGFRVVTRWGTREQDWAHRRVGLPGVARVARRTELDSVLLEAARRAGCAVIEDAPVKGLRRAAGRVVGVEAVVDGHPVVFESRVVIGADGATSRTAKAAGLRRSPTAVLGYAARAEVRIEELDERYLAVYPELMANSQLVPAYGWAFPLGGGVANVGVGFVSTGRDWRTIKIPALVEDLVRQFPPSWKLTAEQILASDSFSGWKLPMGMAVAPLWRPGFLVAGDAAGVAKPFTGAGISKAVQSGLLAGEVAATEARSGSYTSLRRYEDEVRRMWGRSHRAGAAFTRAIGRPAVMSAFVRALGTGTGGRTAHVLFSQALGRRRDLHELRA